MGLPALKIEPEVSVEERVGRLEVTVEHMQADIGEIKSDLRGLRTEIKEMDQRLTSRIDGVKDSVGALEVSMEKSFGEIRVSRMADRVWWLVMSAGMLAVMARGFKWI